MTAVPASAPAPVRLRRTLIGLAVVCVTFATSACAAGRHASTAKETPAVDAAGTTIGALHLQGVAIKAPTDTSYESGSDAELLFIVVNTGQQTDTLTSITTTAAKGASDSAATSESASASTSVSSSASSSASGSASASAPAATFTPVEIPAGERRSFGLGDAADYHLMLTGLSQDLFGGNSVRVTFTFAKAGSKTISVPVQITITTTAPVVTAGQTAGETPAE